LERLGWEGENPQRVIVPNDDDDDDDDIPLNLFNIRHILPFHAAARLPFVLIFLQYRLYKSRDMNFEALNKWRQGCSHFTVSHRRHFGIFEDKVTINKQLSLEVS
jgi:hypothetical protein